MRRANVVLRGGIPSARSLKTSTNLPPAPKTEIVAPPANADEYELAAAVMTAEDEFGLKFLKYVSSPGS